MLQIIKKVFITQIRNPKWSLFLLFFTIALIIFISFVLVGAFENRVMLSEVEVVCLDEAKGMAKEVIDAITSASISIRDNYGINIQRIDSLEAGKNAARVHKKVFVHLGDDKIQVFYNQEDSIAGSRVSGLFQGISNTIQVVRDIHKINYDLGELVLSENNSAYEVPSRLLDDDGNMTSYDYYGVAELVLMILYMMMIPFGDIFTDRDSKVKERLSVSGMSHIKYYLSSLIAYIALAAILFLPAFFVSIYIMGTNWGGHEVPFYLYLMLFSTFIIILGMFLATFLKARGKIEILFAIIILPVFSFLGGSYTPFPFDLSGVMHIVTLLSPVRWVNLGIFNSIYSDDNTMLIVGICLLAGLSGIMFALINWKARKDELNP